MAKTVSERELKDLRAQVEKKRSETEQAKGALGQLKQRLKEEFKCTSIEEAEKELKLINQEIAEAEAEYTELEADYEKKYG